MSFFEKFFGYFKDEEGNLAQYNDWMGHNFIDIRHLIWIIVTILLVILLIQLSKKHKEGVITFCKGTLAFMFVQRVINQIVRAILVVEHPFWRVLFPAHLCTTMIYLLPIVVLFHIKKLKKPVYFLSALGGIITILEGNYFASVFMPFGTLEGIFAHTVISTVPIVLMYNEKEHFNLHDVKNIYLFMEGLMLWATMVNMLLLYLNPWYDPNYLYLVNNMLPFGGKHFVYLYVLIFTIIVFLTYFFNNTKNKEKVKKELKENRMKILVYGICLILYTYVLTVLNGLLK